ncbi:hypothetical protein E2C01_005873 [Portunus trituberculatus]|uniref:Uncharacterized protein n=1 Tax=Portunus trituberculatus TaxID=210409 RepID=A0A5B7CTT7_PORTR|nr:hypothetical protein [Portunus trituberculatus]
MVTFVDQVMCKMSCTLLTDTWSNSCGFFSLIFCAVSLGSLAIILVIGAQVFKVLLRGLPDWGSGVSATASFASLKCFTKHVLFQLNTYLTGNIWEIMTSLV